MQQCQQQVSKSSSDYTTESIFSDCNKWRLESTKNWGLTDLLIATRRDREHEGRRRCQDCKYHTRVSRCCGCSNASSSNTTRAHGTWFNFNFFYLISFVRRINTKGKELMKVELLCNFLKHLLFLLLEIIG